MNKMFAKQEKYDYATEEIPTTKLSEILLHEFMEPMGLSVSGLAQGSGMPESVVEDILSDREKINEDSSLKLGRFFGVSDRYFLGIQNSIDVRKGSSR